MHKKYILIGFAVIVSQACLGQPTVSPFGVHRTSQNGYADEIFFIDTASGDTIAEFDIVANNPYGNFELPKLNLQDETFDAEFWMTIYDISTPTLQDKVRDYLINVDVPQVTEDPITLRSFVVTSKDNHLGLQHSNYIVVGYNLTVVSEGGDDFPKTRNGSLIILNQDGEIISSMNDVETDIITPFISMDGQYVAFAYGGSAAHVAVEQKGFKIFNVATGELLVDVESDCSGSSGRQQNMFQYGCGTLYYIFQPTIPAVYKKQLTAEEAMSLVGIEEEGFSFNQNGEIIKQSYSEYFERLW